MADEIIKIQELPETNTIGDSDVLPIVQGGVTYKIPVSVMRNDVAESTVENVEYVDGTLTVTKNGTETDLFNAEELKTDLDLTKADVGLGNVDNTSDLAKPISTATQAALNTKQNALTFDDSPVSGSSNPVKSSGIYTALAGKKNTQTAKTSPSAAGNSLSFIDTISQNENGEITATKKNVPVDSVPTEGSNNPVKSGGVYSAVSDLNQALNQAVSLLDQSFAWMNITWEQGSIVNGEDQENAYFVRSNFIEINNNTIVIDPQNKQAITVFIYSSSGVFERKTSDYTVLTTLTFKDKKIRFIVRKEPISAITPATIGMVLIYKSLGVKENRDSITELDRNISQLHAQVGTSYIPLEMGYVSINTDTGAFTYDNNTKRVRTIHEIILPIGTVISLSDYTGKRMNVAYTLPNGKGGYSGWLTTDYIVQDYNNGQSFQVMLAFDPDAEITDITEFSDLFSVILPNGLTYRVNEIENKTDELEQSFYKLDVPSYWVSTLEAKETIINNLDAEIGENGCSFIFWTDMHWPANYKKSPSLIKHILDHTGVTEVVCGGDILGGYYASQGLAYKDLVNFRNTLTEYEIKLLSLRGNHDLAPDGILYLTDNQFYGAMLKPYAKLATLIRKTYYYRDDNTLKIRYYYLDSRMVSDDSLDQDQITWLESNLNSVPSDWSIIIFVHSVHINPNGSSSTEPLQTSYPAFQIIQALNRTGKKQQLIAMIGGHTHRDEISTDYGCLLISVTTDAGGTTASDWDPFYPTRTQGTTTEQAFDVFHIDIVNRTIYMTRIGAGIDRQVTY